MPAMPVLSSTPVAAITHRAVCDVDKQRLSRSCLRHPAPWPPSSAIQMYMHFVLMSVAYKAAVIPHLPMHCAHHHHHGRRWAPESEHAANAGLAVARKLLEPVKAAYPWISYADLWTLAGAVAIEAMGGVCDWGRGREGKPQQHVYSVVSHALCNTCRYAVAIEAMGGAWLLVVVGTAGKTQQHVSTVAFVLHGGGGGQGLVQHM